ncbi:MAG: hypothetical protein HFJ12_07580 [Bacilli bacterium]|nr:hypothetical protein [Bacilli bacterium]
MANYKLFISHSSKDKNIVEAFVDFMYKVGLTEKDIVCTSVAGTHIPIRKDIYKELNNLLSDEYVYAIFFCLITIILVLFALMKWGLFG